MLSRAVIKKIMCLRYDDLSALCGDRQFLAFFTLVRTVLPCKYGTALCHASAVPDSEPACILMRLEWSRRWRPIDFELQSEGHPLGPVHDVIVWESRHIVS